MSKRIKTAQVRQIEIQMRRLFKARSQVKALRLAFSNNMAVKKPLSDIELFLNSIFADWHLYGANLVDKVGSPMRGMVVKVNNGRSH